VAHWLDTLPAWSLALAYLAASLAVAVLARWLLSRSLRGIASARPSDVSDILAAVLPRPVAITLFLVMLSGGLRLLPLGQPKVVALHRLVVLGLDVVGVGAAMRIAFQSIDSFGRSKPELKSTAGMGRAVTWVVGIGFAAVAVSDSLGISLAPALTALGVGSLAVALALQDTLSNFFSGVYIVFDKPVRPGDYIRLDSGAEGYVEAIGWRSTHLRTQANNRVVIPNATLSKAIVTNYSLPTPEVASSVRFDIAPDADIDKAENLLSEEARRALDLPGIAQAPAPGVILAPGFVDGAVAFTVFFTVRRFEDQVPVQHALRKRIAARLKKEGIALASVKFVAIAK
jgi:small-conductance mechanosensitive channel